MRHDKSVEAAAPGSASVVESQTRLLSSPSHGGSGALARAEETERRDEGPVSDEPSDLESGARPAERRASTLDWRTLLAGASPREVLARLVAKDTLALRPRVAAALAERCYLLDADAVYLRAVARVARFSTRYRGDPPLDVWLREQIDDAIGDCLERGRREDPAEHVGELSKPPAPGASTSSDGARESAELDRSSVFRELARPLGLEPERMRAVCAGLNGCTSVERAAFFALVLDRENLEAAAARLALSPADCARAARRALDLCMLLATRSPRASERPAPAEEPR